MSASASNGSQTLARGVGVLKRVAASTSGLTVADVAADLGVHRSIATRLLQTLAREDLIVRGDDGRYRGGIGLIALARSGISRFNASARPVLRGVADALGLTVVLFVEQGDEAVSLIVESPRAGQAHLAIAEGARFGFERGAGALAIRLLHVEREDDPSWLTEARQRGWIRTHSEVERGVYAFAVPLHAGPEGPRASLAAMALRDESLDDVLAPLSAAVAQLS